MNQIAKLNLLFWLCCLAIAPPPLHAQEGDNPAPAGPTTHFAHLTTADGLPNNHVEVIFQDSQGFMWFGANDGLSRYDGYHFTNYRHNPDNPHSLAGNRILDIIEDKQGRLWIANSSNGVTLFEPRTEQFTPLQFDSSTHVPNVFTLFEDRAGFIWFGSPAQLVSRYDPATGKLTFYSLASEERAGLEHGAIWDIIEDESGHLWLAASNALVKLDPQSGQFTAYVPPDDSGEIRSLHRDPAGHIWLHGADLHRFDPRSERFTTYPLPLQTNILSILADSRDNIWIATFDGLLLFDLTSRRFPRHFQHQPTISDSLSDNRIFSLYEDRAGLIWIGTDTAGLNRFNPRQSQFVHYRFGSDNGAARVTAITGDEAGVLWLGIERTLYQLDPASGQIKHYALDQIPASVPFGIVALHREQSGPLWFSLANTLYRFDEADRTFTRYEIESSDRPGPPNPIIAIYQDSAGSLWLGHRINGLFRFDPAGGTFEPHSLALASQGGRRVNNASVLYEAPNGELWVAGLGGLGRFDPNRPEIAASVYSIAYVQANALYQNRPDRLWIAAQDGLYRFDPATESYTHYSDQDGLLSNQIMSILADAQGNLWLGTGSGLTRFDPRLETFRNYDMADGLQNSEFNAGAAWQAPDGRLFFGGAEGLTAFYPDRIKDNPYPPPVRFTELRLFNKPLTIGPDSLLKRALNYTEQLTFNYDQKIITFEFAALSYTAPAKNRYRYKLEGFEPDWNEVDSERRFATYTNLPPGEYLLRVQGSNNSGLWSEQEAILNLTILPPWWGTVWFRAVVLAGLAGLLYSGYRWRLYALEQRSRQLETDVAVRTSALQESEKRFREMTELLPGAVVEMDSKFTITYMNKSGIDLFGYTEADIEAGLNAMGMIHPDERERAIQRIANYLEDKYVSPTEYHILKKDGAELPVLLKAAPIRRGKEVIGFRASLTDITEIKEAEQKLANTLDRAKRLRNEAEAANLAKSTFLANMSHELRTPLNAIIGFAQIIARSKSLPPEQREQLAIINRSSEHLLTLINQVLELSKIEANWLKLEETVCDLPNLLIELESMFRLQADDKGLWLIFDRSPHLPRAIRTDEVKLRQVLINLLSNALKFTQEGSVTLKVWVKEKPEPAIHHSSFLILHFAVIDTGPGIAPEEMEDLFEAFSQTETGRQAQEGTGLGLAISHKFVQLLGGEDIWVESPAPQSQSVGNQGGPGTAFTFDIQVEVVSPVTMETESVRSPLLSELDLHGVSLAPNQPRYRILIVDDDSTNRQLLREFLAPFGFALQEAENGRQAIEIWQQFQPHLIWMDMRMPVLDGYQATKIIKSNLKAHRPEWETVIIAVTASSFEEEKAEILSAGCDDFLRKPFREAELIQMMSRHLGIQFIYETPTGLAATDPKQKQPLTPEMLAALSPDQLDQLVEAIELSDIAQANEIITDIQRSQPELAATLSRLVNNFEYGPILATISRIR